MCCQCQVGDDYASWKLSGSLNRFRATSFVCSVLTCVLLLFDVCLRSWVHHDIVLFIGFGFYKWSVDGITIT